jgi:uncharacterized protein YndB with AHSA1/START domain
MVLTRVFDAPVEQVWNAWRDSEIVKQWWGPLGFTCPVAEMDFREGGTSLVCMRAIGLPPDIPAEVRHVLIFKPLGDNQTEFTVTEYGYSSDQTVEMSRAGMAQCLDKMAACFG